MKKYKCALVVGRFQPLHYGHLAMISKARVLAEKVIILISSAQESGTTTNPFSYEEREKMVRGIYPEEKYKNIIVKPIEDIGVGNNNKWGDYVLKTAGEDIDLFITGVEERRANWFGDNSPIEVIALEKENRYLRNSVSNENISSTRVRESMLNGSSYWKDNTPETLREYYQTLIPVLRAAKKTKTKSI